MNIDYFANINTRYIIFILPYYFRNFFPFCFKSREVVYESNMESETEVGSDESDNGVSLSIWHTPGMHREDTETSIETLRHQVGLERRSHLWYEKCIELLLSKGVSL